MSLLEARDTTSSLSRKELPRLSLQERDSRWANIRLRMQEDGIDCLLIWGDSGKWDQKSASMRYVGHIGGNGEDGWLVFPADGDPTAFIFSGGAMLQMWHDLQDWVTDIRSVPGTRWSSGVSDRITELGMENARIGIVGLTGYQESEGTAPYTTVSVLQDRFRRAEFVDATKLLEDLRLYKSKEEVSFIEEATRIGDAAIQVLRESARPGVSEIEAYARTHEALLREGSEQPVTLFWDAGREVNHAQRYPGRRVLEAGDTILTEISPRYYGYWAHFQAPVGVGGSNPRYQELMDVAYDSYMEGLSVFRPGITLGDLAVAFERVISAAGMTSLHVYAHGTGGRGTEFPVLFPPFRRKGMPPESLAAFDRLMEIEVKEGMVMAFEPHVTKDMVHGLHLGDPVVVEGSGCRRLSKLDLREWASVQPA